MPLPRPQSQWPPAPFDQAHAAVAEAQDWWIGSPSALSERYNGVDRGRGGSWTAGLQDKLGWGKSPARSNSPARRVHVPIAADLASVSKTLLLSDPWSVSTPGGNAKATERADLIFNTGRQHSSMLEAAEACAALGWVFPRVVWNTKVADHPWIEYADADQALPFFTHGRIDSVLFWRVLVDDKDLVIRHFEWHTRGAIHHALYQGSHINVGRVIPLTDLEETASIPVNADGVIPTGIDQLTAGYVPNGRSNPAWRNTPGLRHLGRSDFADPGVISLMDLVDDAYSSLARDIRLAKARIMVDQNLVQVGRAGRGAAFDVDQEAFTLVKSGGADVQPTLDLLQADIRVEQHLRAAEAYTREILRRVGYSPATFGLSDDVAMTATEVDAQVRQSVQTHKVKSGQWIGGHLEVCEAALLIDAQVFKTGASLADGVDITWAPPVRESQLQRASTVEALDRARAVSLETKVAMLWPEKDEKWREQEVKRIRDEQAVPDPFGPDPDAPLPGTETDPVDLDDPDEGIDPDADPDEDAPPIAA